jgi:O-antigen/teichoic acid export membrane protein
MRAHFANAAFGVLDYAAYPIGMLAVAPTVLRNLGTEKYGIWTVATAAVSMGSIIASGFGDANIQHVATERSVGDPNALTRAVRNTMGIHLVLGVGIAAIACAAAQTIAHLVTAGNPELEKGCLWSLLIAGLAMFIRAIESVCISTQRAFERYGYAVRISILARVLCLAAAALLSAASHSVVLIMAATVALTGLGACAQVLDLKALLHVETLAPAFDRQTTRALAGFGIFSWLLAVCGVVFSQADRLIGGTTLGAAGVVPYALCTQLSQPIYGVAASGLHFLFPYLVARRASGSVGDLRRAVLLAFAVNLVLVAAGTLVLVLLGDKILRMWVGGSIASESKTILPIVALSAAALGLNVTATYAMLALNCVRAVTWLNVAGGLTMLLLIAGFLSRYGISAIAASRLVYGLITLLTYIPLARLLRSGSKRLVEISTTIPAAEEA